MFVTCLIFDSTRGYDSFLCEWRLVQTLGRYRNFVDALIGVTVHVKFLFGFALIVLLNVAQVTLSNRV